MSILIIGKGLAAGALVTSALFAGTHATTSTPSTAAAPATACHPLWNKAPADLKADIKAMRALPRGEQRREARQQIREDARAGKYGERVQRLAEHRKEIRHQIRRELPSELRQDIRAARRLEGQSRRDALAKIRKDALAGGYGDKVESLAQRRQQHRQDCRAQRSRSADVTS